jgi:hypothetical protein
VFEQVTLAARPNCLLQIEGSAPGYGPHGGKSLL